MISKRIREIAKLIKKEYSFVDIGCDHGYLALLARENGNKNLIICSDNKEGPLNNARKNLENYNNILFVLSDGLKEVNIQTDVAVLAGMGYLTVKNIILDSLDYFKNCKQIIIQVNQNVSLLRKWLSDNDFKIVAERMIYEYKYYEILVIENGKMKLNEEQIMFGPYLLKEKSETFIDCYKKQINKLNKILNDLNNEHPDRLKIEKKVLKMKKMLED
ncbi:MAG: SAM-dependent methyltransferase [Erysipelotrichia bacterium]|nr:SAM-dependent methyltransferase [Erysipelotrichia bacterium]